MFICSGSRIGLGHALYFFGSFSHPLTRKEAIVTRESKLALIIGFVLVLVVGVLVSDHFSQANTMSLDLQAPEDARVIAPLADLGQREEQRLDSALDQAMGDRRDARAHASMPTTQPSKRSAGPVMISKRSAGPVMISNSSEAASKAKTRANPGSSILDRAMDHVQEIELPRAAQLAPRATRANPRPLPETPLGRYEVVAGDTLIGIARRTLGDGRRWTEIHRLNADVLGPDAILKIGMELKLPRDARADGSQSNTTQRSGASAKTYTVVSGDTLGEISMKLLGTSRRADEIAEFNGLESANDIRIGMTLKIPAR